VIVARTLLEASHAIVTSGVRVNAALRSGDDMLSRDLATAHSRACAEGFGLDWDEIHELAMAFVDEIDEMARENVMRPGITPQIAYNSAAYSGLVGAVLAVGCALSGVDPADEVDPFTQHPEIPAGGWICGHGTMVTVLGIDSAGMVAYQYEGELVNNLRRPTPEAFLGHYTRIDDVPILGGGEA
jgi:hypothetical protein